MPLLTAKWRDIGGVGCAFIGSSEPSRRRSECGDKKDDEARLLSRFTEAASVQAR
jgi:hypothetical protein